MLNRETMERALTLLSAYANSATSDETSLECARVCGKLRQELAANQSDWIPVAERLPEDETDIICALKTGEVYPMTTFWDGDTLYLRLYTDARIAFLKSSDITHWQKLPAPPQPEQEGK